jgi:hypothetical protein
MGVPPALARHRRPEQTSHLQISLSAPLRENAGGTPPLRALRLTHDDTNVPPRLFGRDRVRYHGTASRACVREMAVTGVLVVVCIAAAVLVGAIVWAVARKQLGHVAAAGVALIGAVVAGALATASRPLVDRVMIQISDDYAWHALSAGIDKTGFNIRLLFEVDPAIEQEFKREAVALVRRYGNDPEQISRAAEKLGFELYRKYIGPKAPYGSPDSVLEWGRSQLALLETVAGISKDDCGDVAIGRTAVLGRLGQRIAPVLNRAIAASIAAYKSSDPATKLATEQELEPIWQRIFTGPGTPFTQDDIQAFTRIDKIPRPRACDLTITFLKQILALSRDEAVRTLRAVLVEAGKG